VEQSEYAIATIGENKSKRGRPRITPEEKRQRRNLRRRIAKLKTSGELPIRLKQLEDELAERTEPKPRTKREYIARIDQPLAPRGLHRPDDAAYHNGLTALVAACYGQIQSQIYDLDQRLGFRSVGFAMEKLSGRVHQFLNVPLDEGAFTTWGVQYAILWANRYQRWYATATDKRFAASVSAGVWDWMKDWNLPPVIDQLADEITSEARIWLFSHLNDRRETATIFTRVRKWAEWQAMAATASMTASAKRHVPLENLAEDADGNPKTIEVSEDDFEPGYVKALEGHTGELPYTPELEAYALDYD
jgi:hypothetical protein